MDGRCSRSYHLPVEFFQQILAWLVADVHCSLRLNELRVQAQGYPLLLSVRENQHLKCAILEVQA